MRSVKRGKENYSKGHWEEKRHEDDGKGLWWHL